jgi:hypothetical protein
MRIIRVVFLSFVVVVSLVVVLFFVRFILPSQIDDVNPLMNCSDEVLELADVYFVVPKFSGFVISENRSWCDEILDRDKKLALHGVYHIYEEFGVYRDEEYFSEGVEIFEECFGFAPTRFKPGQLAWTSENDWIKEKMEVDLFWNQLFHKVYHCGDSGIFPNWVVRIF